MPNYHDILTIQGEIAKLEELAAPYITKLKASRERLEQVRELVWRDVLLSAGLPEKVKPEQLDIITSEKKGSVTYKVKVRAKRSIIKEVSPEIAKTIRGYIRNGIEGPAGSLS